MTTDELAAQFESHRPHLRAVAYRMLGSLTEAEDAAQEAWLRLVRSDIDAIDNFGGWLTTVTGRICLDLLRVRVTRGERPLVHLPDPIVSPADGSDPEHEALLADSLGLALLIVVQTLHPVERLAFILHDMFAVPSTRSRGAATVASRAMMFAGLADTSRPMLVNGAAGIIATAGNQVMSLMAFTVSNGRIVEINVLTDPERLREVVPTEYRIHKSRTAPQTMFDGQVVHVPFRDENENGDSFGRT